METACENVRGLAFKLIRIYTEHKLPRAAEMNRKYPEGFTKEKLQDNPDALYQMIILAAYDRQPFTRVARGWEPIWGLVNSGPSLPTILRAEGLFDTHSVLALSLDEIHSRLAPCRFFRYRLDSDGANTRYCRVFRDAAILVVNHNLRSLVMSARTAEDVKNLHRLLDSIHGIGPTIASKLVMYTLREIGFGDINPKELHPAVAPILAEYHNARLANELRKSYGQHIVEQLFEALRDLGDPFAIDALYYVDRDEPQLKKLLLSEATT
jgi:hypothetical protein